jgi:hypothetical protein
MTPAAHPRVIRPSGASGGAGLGALFFGLSAGPVAWYFQLIVNYALASHSCFPDGSPLGEPAGWHAVAAIAFAANIVAILVALGASAVSLRIWLSMRHDHPALHSDILAPAIGRGQFLASTSAMTGLGSVAATVFSLMALLTVPPCAG